MHFATIQLRHFPNAWWLGLFAIILVACDAPPHHPVSYTQRLQALTTAYIAQPADSRARYGTDSLVSRLTRALQEAGIDTILHYQHGCQGCEAVAASATRCRCNAPETSVYLCWRHQDITLAQQIDCCRSYAPVQVSNEVFDFYFRHQAVFDAGQQFYTHLREYNLAHPAQPKFLPPVPVHGGFDALSLRLPLRRLDISVRTGEYDSLGNPTLLPYPWKRKHGEWARLLAKQL